MNAVTDCTTDTPRVDVISRRHDGHLSVNEANAQYNDLLDLARQLERENATLLGAAKESLNLLQTGAPGWGVAKDLLRAAIHKALGK